MGPRLHYSNVWYIVELSELTDIDGIKLIVLTYLPSTWAPFTNVAYL